MKSNKPSEFHADLKEEHITKLAQLITSAYEDAVEHIREDKGDTNWGLGCRRYEWARQNIRVAAQQPGFEFLSLLEDEGNKFTFMVGAVPVRFKRGDSENLDAGMFTQYETEASQLSLLSFYNMADPCELSWRMLMEVDWSGQVIRAVFIGATETGYVKCFWEVPHSALRGAPVPITEKAEGVELKPAPVSLKTDAKKAVG